MATDKNTLLWAIRGIEDTDTLRVACEELERVLYHANIDNGSMNLSDRQSEASEALQAVIRELPENNISLD